MAGREEKAGAEAGTVGALGAPREGAPEAQRLVARARHDGLPVGAHREVEDAVCVEYGGGRMYNVGGETLVRSRKSPIEPNRCRGFFNFF